jgi:hypothetical protein
MGNCPIANTFAPMSACLPEGLAAWRNLRARAVRLSQSNARHHPADSTQELRYPAYASHSDRLRTFRWTASFFYFTRYRVGGKGIYHKQNVWRVKGMLVVLNNVKCHESPHQRAITVVDSNCYHYNDYKGTASQLNIGVLPSRTVCWVKFIKLYCNFQCLSRRNTF